MTNKQPLKSEETLQARLQREVGRIWIFIAYENCNNGSIPIFSKLFDDHLKLKAFSAKHSSEFKAKTKGYHSTYLDLTDKTFINQTIDHTIAETIKAGVSVIDGKKKKDAHDFCVDYQDGCEKCANGHYNQALTDASTALQGLVDNK